MGDVIAQIVVSEKDEKFDYSRVSRAWIFGTFILGPLAHAHFNFLEWLVVRRVSWYGYHTVSVLVCVYVCLTAVGSQRS